MPRPSLLESFPSGVFTRKDAARVVGANQVTSRVQYLRKQGYVRVVRKGLYAFVPETTRVVPDKYVLGSKVQEDAVLGFHSAFELLGVAHTAFFERLFICTRKRTQPFRFAGTTYRPVYPQNSWQSETFQRKIKRAGATLRIAGPELALAQCLHRVDYGGGVFEIIQSAEGLRTLDWDKLRLLVQLTGGEEENADKKGRGPHGRSALASKLGFLAERNEDRWSTPPEFLVEMQKHVRNTSTYFGVTRRVGGRWVARWKLAVPKTLEEA